MFAAKQMDLFFIKVGLVVLLCLTGLPSLSEAGWWFGSKETSQTKTRHKEVDTLPSRFKGPNKKSARQLKNGLLIHESVLVHDTERTSLVYLPKSYKKDIARPLVIVLHGARLTGWLARATTGFDKIADDEQFIVAYPNALNRQWNDGRRESDNPSFGVDDEQFLLNLIETLVWKYNANRDQVFLTGYSSGGMMAQRFALKHTEAVQSIAEVASTLPLEQFNNKVILKKPLPVLMINGTKDKAFPWNGGTTVILRVKVGPVISVMSMLEYWVEANGGRATLPNQHASFLQTEKGADVDVLNIRTKNNTCMMLYKIKGGGHTWPGSEVALRYIPFLGKQTKDLNASELIWQFFNQNEHDCSVIQQ